MGVEVRGASHHRGRQSRELGPREVLAAPEEEKECGARGKQDNSVAGEDWEAMGLLRVRGQMLSIKSLHQPAGLMLLAAFPPLAPLTLLPFAARAVHPALREHEVIDDLDAESAADVVQRRDECPLRRRLNDRLERGEEPANDLGAQWPSCPTVQGKAVYGVMVFGVNQDGAVSSTAGLLGDPGWLDEAATEAKRVSMAQPLPESYFGLFCPRCESRRTGASDFFFRGHRGCPSFNPPRPVCTYTGIFRALIPTGVARRELAKHVYFYLGVARRPGQARWRRAHLPTPAQHAVPVPPAHALAGRGRPLRRLYPCKLRAGQGAHSGDLQPQERHQFQ